MDRLRAVAAKIIADYKEHYDFPPQGESHMEDCIMGAIESVRSEALADAWLIEHANGSKEVVLSPLTDDHRIDEGDEAVALYRRAG